MYVYNPSTGEAERDGIWVQNQPGLHNGAGVGATLGEEN